MNELSIHFTVPTNLKMELGPKDLGGMIVAALALASRLVQKIVSAASALLSGLQSLKVALVVHWVDALPGLDIDEHVIVLDGAVPVVVLGGKLDGVALSVVVHLLGTGPQMTADPIAVFVPRGNRLDGDGGIETDASSTTPG